ncbi:MAG: VIT1/CCC1 transporter family protein [Patescibacteria group bacterium]|nr:VIT1/CCC1 transporter family protein [Patescibacteria group bacterium]
MPSKIKRAAYVRNFIFGVEDSLVSTVGLVSGVAAAGVDRSTIFITGLILIVVEALSMGVGSMLSETSAEEFIFRKIKSDSHPTIGGLIMFISYFVAGFIPLIPYILFDVTQAFPLSILASLVALFLLGYVSARFYKARVLKSGVRMLVLGGLAIFAGVLVGSLLR